MEEGEGKVTVLHVTHELPLFYVDYGVMISKEPIEALEFITEDMYPGVKLDFTNDTRSYCCTIKHDIMGKSHLIYIRSESSPDANQPIESLIAHESVNMAWVILKELGIEVNHNNNVIHGFVVSELTKQITKTLRDFEENSNDIDEL